MPTEFWEWITKKYVEWRGATIGKDGSISEFANWVGVSQPVMSTWMKRGGKVPRSQKSIAALVRKFGNEVYEVLDIPLPEADFSVESLPTDLQIDLRLALAEIKQRIGDLDPDSPEGDKLVRSVLRKHGFAVEKISDSG